MLSLQRTLSAGYLGKHWIRTVLVVAIIALGVSALVATRALNQSLGKAAPGAVDPLSSLADLLVVNGQTGVPRALVEKLKEAQVPGVRKLNPIVIGRVAIPELENRAVMVIGIELDTDNTAAAESWGLKPNLELAKLAKATLDRRTPAMLGAELAADLADADSFHVRCAGHEQRLDRVGTIELTGQAIAVGANVLFLRLEDAAPLVCPERPDHFSRLNVLLEPDADREALRRRLQEVAGDQAEVRTVEANDQTIRDVTAGLELGFSISGIGALVVGLFLVYMILSVSVAERRHDIGILRSVGATRGQIAGLFVGEAAVLGLAGSLLGVPAGLGMAQLLLGPMRAVLSEIFVPLENVSLDLWSPGSLRLMVSALASGVLTAMLAAMVPACSAAGEEPADAVRRVPVKARLLTYLLAVGGCGLLLALGTACVTWRELLPLRAGTFGGFCFLFVGALMATPLLTALLAPALRPLTRSLLGLEGRLAADNLVRSPVRTGLVIAVLAATGALLVHLAGFIHSSKAGLFEWIDESIAADLFVTAGSSVSANGLALPMDERIGKEIAKLPGVEAALPVHFHRLDYRDRIVIMIAVDTRAFENAAYDHALARNLARFPELRNPGTTLVSDNFASLYGVSVGDRVAVRGRKGTIELKVIGTVVDYTWNRGTLLVDRTWFREEYGDAQVDVFDVYLHPGADREAVRREIQQRWGKKEAIFVADRDEVRREIASALDRVYGLAYVQQTVIAVVALLGVTIALFISVLQRRRELGLLRAVGASRSQIMRTVLAEATLMGLIGAVIGFGVGMALEWYVIEILVRDEAGFIFPLRVAWLPAAFVFGLSVALATLVGLWPAYQATQLRIPEAIAYE
jgi:putative ABC transport system permease protein